MTEELNDWFLSLPEPRQKALIGGGMWMLADAAFQAGRAAPSQPEGAEPVAQIESWTNGSYSRNYKIKWLKNAPEGAFLYLHPSQSAGAASQALSNLLAVIHGDGGHYEQEHGTQQACKDAEHKVAMRFSAGAAAPDEGEGWQPISTAPKDGTRFLAWKDGRSGFFHWQGRDDGSPIGWRDSFITVYPEGSQSAPKFWMPCPSAPKGEAATPSSQGGQHG